MSTGDACKAEGNAAFHNKRFEEAVEWYTKAIGFDGRNAVYFNNRAAAYLELSKYKDAAADAERSAILSPTAKANVRLGRARWQMNQLKDALAAFEGAKRLDPSNTEIDDFITQVKRGIAAENAGTAASGAGTSSSSSAPRATSAAPPAATNAALAGRAIQADVAIIFAAVVYVLLMFFSAVWSQRAWVFACIAMLVRMAITKATTTPAAEMRTFGFWKDYVMKKMTTEFAGQYIALCAALLIAGCPGQQFLLIAFAIYSSVDLVVGHRATIEEMVRTVPQFQTLVAPRIQQVADSKQQMYLQAGACEALAFLMSPVSCGGSFISMMVIAMFAKLRYTHDAWSQQAWRGLHQQVYQLTRHPSCPGIVGSIFDKIAAALHRAGAQ